MKIFKIIKFLPRAIKGALTLYSVVDLQVNKKFEEALILLEKDKDVLEGKNFKYHLHRGRILVNARDDYKAAIEEYMQGISLLNSDKKINSNRREYCLAWAKYVIAGCYYDLGEKEIAETWRTESEKHDFDIDRVSTGIKGSFPMKWHVDYKS